MEVSFSKSLFVLQARASCSRVASVTCIEEQQTCREFALSSLCAGAKPSLELQFSSGRLFLLVNCDSGALDDRRWHFWNNMDPVITPYFYVNSMFTGKPFSLRHLSATPSSFQEELECCSNLFTEAVSTPSTELLYFSRMFFFPGWN